MDEPFSVVDHVVEVAFGANIDADVELLKQGGSIASYATDNPTPKIPFWQMVFRNIRVFFLGSDDFPKEAKMQAAQDLNATLGEGWSGFDIAETIPLGEIAHAHELVEHPERPGGSSLCCERQEMSGSASSQLPESNPPLADLRKRHKTDVEQNPQ